MSLPRNVKVLGAASLLNDIASEMIFPLLPNFLLNIARAALTPGSAAVRILPALCAMKAKASSPSNGSGDQSTMLCTLNARRVLRGGHAGPWADWGRIVVWSFQFHFEAQEAKQIFESYDATKLVAFGHKQAAETGALHLAQRLHCICVGTDANSVNIPAHQFTDGTPVPLSPINARNVSRRDES